LHGTQDAKPILVTHRIPETRADLCREILSYLADHPRSEDSLEGISEWWLLQHYVTKTRAAVRGALTDLVRHKWVLERVGADGRTTYRLNPRRRSLAPS